MSREYIITPKQGLSQSDVTVNKVIVDRATQEIQFHSNSKHNHEGLLAFLKILVLTATGENDKKPDFSIKSDPESNVITTQGDCAFIVNTCKEQNLFDETSASDMLAYISSSNSCSML